MDLFVYCDYNYYSCNKMIICLNMRRIRVMIMISIVLLAQYMWRYNYLLCHTLFD